MLISQVVGAGRRRVHTAKADHTVSDAAAILAEHRIGALAITDDGAEILGIISERDIVRHLASNPDATMNMRIEELMTNDVTTCTINHRAEDCMAVMVEGHFRHMPVVDGNNHLMGMISLGDLVNARLEDLAAENRELREVVGPQG